MERDPRQDPHPAWTLSDGHAGNVRQATALADAIGMAGARAITVAPRAPWRWLAPRIVPGSPRAFGQAFAAALAAPPRLAIGCGRQAALATRLLRAAGSRAVQILAPRIDPGHWDLVIAPEHDGLAGGNVLTLLGSLHPVDAAWLARARADFDLLAQLPQPRTTLLVGGPGRAAPLDAAGLAAQLESLAARLRAEGGSLLVTTSRRTPPAWQALVRRACEPVPGLRWFAPTAAGAQDDENPYPGLLAWADRIVCTPDSVNMASEACATTVPVHVIAPQATRGRLRRFHDSLLAAGRTRPLDGGLQPWPVDPLRETPRIAALVRERLDLR